MDTSALLPRRMRRFAGLAGCLGLVFTLGAAAAPSMPRGSITNYTGELDGVSALSSSNAWAVGYNSTSTGLKSLVLHWNGTAWAKVASPNPGLSSDLLDGVSARSSSDAWAVGNYTASDGRIRTFVLRWNGTSWKRVASPTPEAIDGSFLLGVSALSRSDAWAVGWNYLTGGEASNTLVLHWNGTSWAKVASPNPLRLSFNELNGVSAPSASSAWAVGDYLTGSGEQKTLMLHWNGSRWAKVAIPSPGKSSALNGVSALSASSAWAVGSSGETLILRWNGSRWAQVASPGSRGGDLSSVSASSPNDAWAVGSYLTSSGEPKTLALHWDGTNWTRAASPSPGGLNGSDLTAVSVLSPSSAWAVGSYSTSSGQEKTLVLHWNGTSWTRT